MSRKYVSSHRFSISRSATLLRELIDRVIGRLAHSLHVLGVTIAHLVRLHVDENLLHGLVVRGDIFSILLRTSLYG